MLRCHGVQTVTRKSSNLTGPQRGCCRGVTQPECKAPSLGSKSSFILMKESMICLRLSLNEYHSF